MPEGFFIGPFHVRFYGIILMLGARQGPGWPPGKPDAVDTNLKSYGIC